MTDTAGTLGEAVWRAMDDLTVGLSDERFVCWCFGTVLRRLACDADLALWTDALRRGLPRAELVRLLLTSPEFQAADRESAEAFPPGDRFSAVPALADRRRHLETERPRPRMGGIDLRVASQIDWIERLAPWIAESALLDDPAPPGRNAAIDADTLLLDAMIRRGRPRRIIALGTPGGLDAERGVIGTTEATVLELERPIPAEAVAALEAGDLLLVRTSHVAKLGSDVCQLVFEVLPALRPGVLVRFLEVFWPFEYPDSWVREGRAWNELYILRAFLQFNCAFLIEYFHSYMMHSSPGWFAENLPQFRERPGTSLWLRRAED
jgi:hypothetical protein